MARREEDDPAFFDRQVQQARRLAQNPTLKEGVWTFEGLPGFGTILTEEVIAWVKAHGGPRVNMVSIPEIADGELRRLHIVQFS